MIPRLSIPTVRAEEVDRIDRILYNSDIMIRRGGSMPSTKVSFDVPEDFDPIWKAFLQSKGEDIPLAKHIRKAIENYLARKENSDMLFLKGPDGVLINLSRVLYVVDNQRVDSGTCFLVFGALTPEERKSLRATVGLARMSEADREKHFPDGKVIRVDMPASHLKAYIETKTNERILDVHEAIAVGQAKLQKG